MLEPGEEVAATPGEPGPVEYPTIAVPDCGVLLARLGEALDARSPAGIGELSIGAAAAGRRGASKDAVPDPETPRRGQSSAAPE